MAEEPDQEGSEAGSEEVLLTPAQLIRSLEQVRSPQSCAQQKGGEGQGGTGRLWECSAAAEASLGVLKNADRAFSVSHILRVMMPGLSAPLRQFNPMFIQ